MHNLQDFTNYLLKLQIIQLNISHYLQSQAGQNYLQQSKLAVTSGTFRYKGLLAMPAHYTINMISLDIMRVNNCYTCILYIENKALNNTADTD